MVVLLVEVLLGAPNVVPVDVSVLTLVLVVVDVSVFLALADVPELVVAVVLVFKVVVSNTTSVPGDVVNSLVDSKGGKGGKCGGPGIIIWF